jgi:hypothetical protein
MEYARKLLSEKLAVVANDGDITGREQIPSASDTPGASQATDASG